MNALCGDSQGDVLVGVIAQVLADEGHPAHHEAMSAWLHIERESLRPESRKRANEFKATLESKWQQMMQYVFWREQLYRFDKPEERAWWHFPQWQIRRELGQIFDKHTSFK